jgi:hypothetical protein
MALAGGAEGCVAGSGGIGPPTVAAGDPGRADGAPVAVGAGDWDVAAGLFATALGGRTTGGAAGRGAARGGGDGAPPAESSARISTETCDQAGDIRQGDKTSMMAAARMQTFNG